MSMKFRYRVMALGMISTLTGVWLSAPLSADALHQDDVLSLVEKGEILPLESLLDRHRHRLRGRIIDLELEHERGQLVYELELIDEQGVVREYLIDARNGEWLGEE